MKINRFISMFLLTFIVFAGMVKLAKASERTPLKKPQLGQNEMLTPEGSRVALFLGDHQPLSAQRGVREVVPSVPPLDKDAMTRSQFDLFSLDDAFNQALLFDETSEKRVANETSSSTQACFINFPAQIRDTIKNFLATTASDATTTAKKSPTKVSLLKMEERVECMTPSKFVETRRTMRASSKLTACCVLDMGDDGRAPKKPARRIPTEEEKREAAEHSRQKQAKKDAANVAAAIKKIETDLKLFMMDTEAEEKELRLHSFLSLNTHRKEIALQEENAFKSLQAQMLASKDAEVGTTAQETINLSHIMPVTAIMEMLLNSNTRVFFTQKTETDTISLEFQLDNVVSESTLSQNSPLRRKYQTGIVKTSGTLIVCLHPVDGQEYLFQSIFHACVHTPSDGYIRKPAFVSAEMFNGQLAFRLERVEG